MVTEEAEAKFSVENLYTKRLRLFTVGSPNLGHTHLQVANLQLSSSIESPKNCLDSEDHSSVVSLPP